MRFGTDFGPFGLPKRLPFGTPWATKIGQKINRKLDCSKCHREIAPRSPKTPLRASQELPRPPQDRPKTPKNAPKRPQVLPRTPKNSAAGTWARDRQTCFLVCHRRGVIPKARGAAGDSAAGVLDPAAPPPALWGRVKITLVKSVRIRSIPDE